MILVELEKIIIIHSGKKKKFHRIFAIIFQNLIEIWDLIAFVRPAVRDENSLNLHTDLQKDTTLETAYAD